MKLLVKAALFATVLATAIGHAADNPQAVIKRAVDQEVKPLMAKYGIPGMAVGITIHGKSYVFDYGVMSAQTRQPVTHDTLFELGSVSKTFTATLAAYAQVEGDLSLSDKTSKYLPSLRGSKFGDVSLLNLGTHTPGGLPLQVPDNIHNNDELMQYLQQWQPTYAPGTYRTYANPGIGLLGLIAAKSMGQDFTVLMEQRLFPALGLKSTYIDVPASKMANYAQGYTKENAPIRMTVGVLSAEAYGVKSTATDMLRFMDANMNSIALDEKLQQAINDTHTGYFKAGAMTQDLIWEQYPYPVKLETLVAGNSSAMILNAMPVTAITPPVAPRKDVWLNKTGSTNGFAAYVALVPEKQLGIVILANKGYPNDDRVTIAHRLMTRIASEDTAQH